MKKIFIILFMFSFFSKVIAGNNGTAYDYEFNSIDGDLIKLSQYKGKVIVVVNVASRCGYTPQYEDLQTLWSEYKSKDLVVLGVPTNNFRQEPGNNKEIKNFCETNFGITFPMTEKINSIKYETVSCVYCEASASLLSRKIKNVKLKDIKNDLITLKKI